jgi:hypothetical protein
LNPNFCWLNHFFWGGDLTCSLSSKQSPGGFRLPRTHGVQLDCAPCSPAEVLEPVGEIKRGNRKSDEMPYKWRFIARKIIEKSSANGGLSILCKDLTGQHGQKKHR